MVRDYEPRNNVPYYDFARLEMVFELKFWKANDG
jgi:hypothetical protein